MHGDACADDAHAHDDGRVVTVYSHLTVHYHFPMLLLVLILVYSELALDSVIILAIVYSMPVFVLLQHSLLDYCPYLPLDYWEWVLVDYWEWVLVSYCPWALVDCLLPLVHWTVTACWLLLMELVGWI